MKNKVQDQAKKKVKNIRSRDLQIYSPIEVGDQKLWLTDEELESILFTSLKGISLQGLPLRTRSKYVKEKVCEALGYKIPKSFKKVKPRFTGQNFDTCIQKSNNIQIWNEEVCPERRYVLIKVSNYDIVEKVKVISGYELSSYDKTGTLTQKYQAKLDIDNINSVQINPNDTSVVSSLTKETKNDVSMLKTSPTDEPEIGFILPISIIYKKLLNLVGSRFKDSGFDQDRNRGSEIHRLVCKSLGYQNYKDDGKFPDIKHQLLEIKLQTSPTIDLGLVCPDSDELLNIEEIIGKRVRHSDVRYVIFYAVIKKGYVEIKNVLISTGKDFFSYFKKFGGNVLNKKIQIPLPKNFF